MIFRIIVSVLCIVSSSSFIISTNKCVNDPIMGKTRSSVGNRPTDVPFISSSNHLYDYKNIHILSMSNSKDVYGSKDCWISSIVDKMRLKKRNLGLLGALTFY